MKSPPQKLDKLLAGVASGDEASFAELYQATSAKLFAVALRILRSREVAEEVLQEAYFRIWERAGDFKPEIASPITWMAAIVRNRSLDEVRRRGSRPHADVSEIEDLESDQRLQDAVLSVFHATVQTFNQTRAVKIIENHKGRAYVKIAGVIYAARFMTSLLVIFSAIMLSPPKWPSMLLRSLCSL